MCGTNRVVLGKLFIYCFALVGFLSWGSGQVAALTRVPAGSFSYTHPAASQQNDPEAISGQAWSNQYDTGTYWLQSSVSLPAGTWYVAARLRTLSGAVGGPLNFEDGSTPVYQGSIGTSSQTYEAASNIWFVVNGEGYGYITVGSFTLTEPTSLTIKTWNPAANTWRFDGLMIYQSGEGFASRAEVNAFLNPEPEWDTLNCTLTTSPVRALDIGGNWAQGGTPVMSYTVENGVLVASGDMTATQEMEALRLATGRKYFSLAGGDYCGPMWVSFGLGGRQFVNSDSFTISEWAFAEIVYWERSIHHGGPSTGYDSQKFLLLWQSANRFSLYGDPLGDVGYRIYQQFAGGTP